MGYQEINVGLGVRMNAVTLLTLLMYNIYTLTEYAYINVHFLTSYVF